MRSLFKLENARTWGSVLIVVGVLLIITAFFMEMYGFKQGNPSDTAGILFLIIGLGIVFIVIGFTVKKICTCIARMMQTYDDEIHKKLIGDE